MKKLYKSLVIFIAISIVGALCAYAAEYTKFSSGFIKHFKDCDRYEETVTSQFEGKTFTTTRRIYGWKNGMCRYQEEIASPVDKYRLNCNLTGVQVDALTAAMKSKSKAVETLELDLYGEDVDKKTGERKFVKANSTRISGNSAYIAWAKVQNNPYFCLPEKISK